MKVFNVCVTPAVSTKPGISPTIDILWVRSDESNNKIFSSTHFVPFRSDYVTQTQERKMKQIYMLKIIKSRLEEGSKRQLRHWFPENNKID